ncbi:tyrosine-protein phosphatase [Nocardia sp. XZ_19_231]|uniref:tyrosine-protein phosphatase n=1 Tax=Nocardia sp. XZ_19_231 TaxID=2769252 RepID=UPI001890744B|nr:tyrosine-protein phosphatase [Nocardia sp. XZ_19_231]
MSESDFTGGHGGVAARETGVPRLGRVDNFRDVAGPGVGYPTQDGGKLRTGVVYRSSVLAPDDSDLAVLNRLALRTVFDLRGGGEVARRPVQLPADAEYRHIPILGGDLTGSPQDLGSAAEAADFMCRLNRRFVTGQAEAAGFGRLLAELSAAQGPVVFHCTAGKDRTGWVSYLLLSLAGVESATILADYLLTNDYTAESNARALRKIEAERGTTAASVVGVLMRVDRAYLQAGIDEIQSVYGSVTEYLTSGLGVDATTMMRLRRKLVE